MIPPRRVLVVVTRRIGDVLLATPLIRSLQRAWPQARIDALVFAGTEGLLAANPDVRGVITIAERPSPWQHLALLARIARRYDIALSLVPSDRPTLYAAIAGRWRAGLVVDTPKHRWKKWLLNRWAAFQAIGRAREQHNAGKPVTKKSYQLNACHMYKDDGPAVKERWPQSYTGK